jgi:hypothetical protein
VLGRAGDHSRFAERADMVKATINRMLFDRERGVYLDGAGRFHHHHGGMGLQVQEQPGLEPFKPSDYADLLAHANRLARPLQERLAFLHQPLEREQA